MEWSERQILETLRLIEESDYDEVKLETDNFKLHVRKSGMPAQLDSAPSSAGPAAPPPAQPQAGMPDTVAAAQPSSRSAKREKTAVPAGMVAIRAPMIGTFYRAPAPHLPPFIEVGASVKPEDTVCLVEVMKLFNTIKAGIAGKVVEIVAQNAATVERDQVLMLIEPLR
jgi:acetyl-CoA carboxylase biotin carboxyl carrier protein